MLHWRVAIVLLCLPLLLTSCLPSFRGSSEPPVPPLIQAARKGDVLTVRSLLGKGADVQARDAQGFTALMAAAENGDAVTVQALLTNSAEVNARDNAGWTALMFAAGSGDTPTVQALLTQKAHVNAKSNDGMTALMRSTKRGHTAVVQMLLANGAEANARDKDEQTALLIAVQGGHIAIVQALLTSGADAQVKNKEGKTALEIAQAEGFSNIAQLLKQAMERSSAMDRPSAARPTAATEPAQTAPAPAGTPGTRDANTPGTIDFGRYEALVIGNNAYAHLRPLKTAINDAIAVGKVLEEMYGFTVTLLTDASREQIIASLDDLRARLTEQDNLLIYYAGHGVLDTGEERGYWLPVEARGDSRIYWIPTTTITDALKAMLAKHVLVVADSCYSGTLVRGIDVVEPRPAPETYLARLAQKRSRTVLTSGGLEPVLDGGGGDHSVFAQTFLAILQDNKGTMDGQQLFSAIRRPVVLNSLQTPEYSDIRQAGHEGGDFLFVRR